MRIRVQAITLAIALLSSVLFMACSVNLAKANPIGAEVEYKALPVITINSPINGTTFLTDNLTLNVTVTKPGGWLIGWGNARQMLKSISYELDGKVYGPFMANSYLVTAFNNGSYLETAFNYSSDLTNLEVGLHSLKVQADANGWVIEIHDLWQREVPITASTDMVYFWVEKSVPNVVIMSIENSSTSDIPLNISINATTSKITYSLDNQENATIAGNTTLTGLSSGLHNVTVYAWDMAGNVGSSETVTFTIAEPEPFPTTLIAVVSGAATAVIGFSLLVYFRKRNH
jgi:hypothetical protein